MQVNSPMFRILICASLGCIEGRYLDRTCVPLPLFLFGVNQTLCLRRHGYGQRGLQGLVGATLWIQC